MECLQKASISYSKAVIRAILAYVEQQTEKERKSTFLREVRSIVREEVCTAPMGRMVSCIQPHGEQKPTPESEDAMLAFLDAFDG